MWRIYSVPVTFHVLPHLVLMVFRSSGSSPPCHRWGNWAADGETEPQMGKQLAGAGPGSQGGALCSWSGRTLELVLSLLPPVSVPVVGSSHRGMPWHSFFPTQNEMLLFTFSGRKIEINVTSLINFFK